jgi:excisionase family DNA binding protein
MTLEVSHMVAANAIRETLERQGYSVDECAYMIGCGRTKVFDLIKEGRIRVVKIGVRTIIPKSEIDRLLNGAD